VTGGILAAIAAELLERDLFWGRVSSPDLAVDTVLCEVNIQAA
jgi:hypothetical protein